MSIESSFSQQLTYLGDTYLFDVETVILQVEPLVIQECIFHPQGGGQPADRGWIDDVEVVPVKQDLVVLRPVDGSVPWVAGQRVKARVDRELRLRHAALHTAGHLTEAAGRSLGWELAGNNHFPGQSRVEFNAGTVDLPEARDLLLAYVQQALEAGPVIASDTNEAGHRIVSIGDLHSAPCGGTHVHSLADLEGVDLEVKVKKGRVRVSYTAEHRKVA